MFEKSIGQSAALLNSDFIAIAMVKDRHIVWANAAMHRIFGYQPDELIGQATSIFFLDQESYEAFGREAYQITAEGGTYTGTILQQRKDGSTGWYEFNISNLSGHPDITVGAIVDRTASHQAAKMLEENGSRYRSVVEDQTEVISRFLPDGTFVFVNDVYCRVFGKSTDELIGQRWHWAAYPDDLPRIEAKLSELTPDNPVVSIEARVFVANGKLRWMQFVKRGFFDNAGNLKEMQSVGRDITQLKQAELSLRESESRYRSVVEDQTEVISRFLPDGTFVFVNEVFCRVFGKSTDELIGQRWHWAAHPDDVLMIEAKLSEMSPDNPVVTIENRVFVANGELCCMQFVNRGLFDRAGNLKETQSVGRDITQLKQTELKLRQSEETLKRAQSIGKIGSFVMGDSADVFKCSKETVRIFDLDEEEATVAEWLSRLHPDDRGKTESAWQAALQGAPYDMTYRIVVQGQIRWIRDLVEVQFDEQGQVAGAIGTAHDITDLKQIEHDLRESEERLELALAGSGLVLWDWNIPECKVTAGNRWFDLLGYKTEELGNNEDDWMALINPKDLERFTQKLTSHLQGETANFESEHRLRHKHGHWVTVEAKGKVIHRDKDNTPLRMVGTILDISQRKRLHEQGLDMLKRIELLIRENTLRSSIKAEEEEEDKAVASLTKRQRQILRMIASGMTSADIGQRLHLSTATIISHRRNLMAKLNLHSTAEVTRFAIEHGLIATE